MKQPDRFDRMVAKKRANYLSLLLSPTEAAALLRAEHRAVVRLIKQQERYGMSNHIMLPKYGGAWISLDDLLAALARRAT